jgi:hypothetical protein
MTDLIAGFLCFVCFAIVVGFVVVSLQVLDFRTIRRTFRSRRFGLPAAFGSIAVVAVTLSIMRGLGVLWTNPGAICIGLFISMYAIAIVGFVAMVIRDLGERFSPRTLRRRYRHDPGLSKSDTGADGLASESLPDSRSAADDTSQDATE